VYILLHAIKFGEFLKIIQQKNILLLIEIQSYKNAYISFWGIFEI